MRLMHGVFAQQRAKRCFVYVIAILVFVCGAPLCPTFAQWQVRTLDLNTDVTTTTQAFISLLQPSSVSSSILSDRAALYNGVDFAGGGGTFTLNNTYPGGRTQLTNAALRATANLQIPAGDWSIAFGSDEGGLLAIGGITFDSKFNSDDAASNEIRFESMREFAWTGGHFSVGEGGLSSAINAIMFEAANSDAWEIAIRNNSDEMNSDNPNTLNDWQLLGNGTQGWSVTSDLAPPTVWVAGQGVVGSQNFSNIQEPALENAVVGSGGDVTEGLVHEWFDIGNSGDLNSIQAALNSAVPIVPAFKTSHSASWWSGGNDPLDVNRAPRYPDAIIDQPRGDSTWNDTDNDNYTVRLSGEIRIEESGVYRFKDASSEFVAFGIDADGNGAIDTAEYLINDNDGVGFNGIGPNGGSPIVSAEIELADPMVDEWRKVEMIVAANEGPDAGLLYWDYDFGDGDFDGLRIGDAPGFPGAPDEGIDTFFFAPDLLIPDSHLRGGEPGEIMSGDLVAAIDDRWVFDLDGSSETVDIVEVQNPNADVFTTIANVEGAEFVLNTTSITEDHVEAVFQIVDADQIVGVPAVIGGEDESWQWIGETGSVQFLGFDDQPAVCGDTDFDGDVDSADRTTVTVMWTGAMTPGVGDKTPEDGDCDDDGDVDSADLTGLVSNWTGAIAAGNLEDGDAVDLVYDPATGNVTIDASDAASGSVISFVLATDQNDLRSENFQTPFVDVGTNTDNTSFQIGQTDPLNMGDGPSVDLGDVLPVGIGSLEELADYLTLAEYASELGVGGAMDLRIVPEPSSLCLSLLLIPLVAPIRRRGKQCRVRASDSL